MKRVVLLAQSNSVRRMVVNTFRGTGGCEVDVVGTVEDVRRAFFQARLEGKKFGETFPNLIILDGSKETDRVVSFLEWLREVEQWSRPVLFLLPRIHQTRADRDKMQQLGCTLTEPLQWIKPAYRFLGLLSK